MYRKRQSSGCIIRLLIVLGMIAGIAYVGIDFFRASRISSETALLPSLPQLPSGTAAESAIAAAPTTAPTSQQASTSLVSSGVQIDSETTRLFIPSAGIEAPITEVFLDGTSWDVSFLGTSVGHLEGTAWMDDGPGNIVLSGHVELSDGRQGVFATLDEVPVGEIVIVTRGTEERRYRVTTVRQVEPDDLTPLYPSTTDQLTLITCGSYNFFADKYEIRTVVLAERIS
ncbi:MAG: sortase [Chitinophagaceae bacterium]|nr:sortase [Anaerolineae bacterium]